MPANFHELTANHIGCACPDTAGGEGVRKSHSDGFVLGGNAQRNFCNEQVGFANGACGRWDGSELFCNAAIRFRTRCAQSGNAFAPLDNEIIGSVHGVEGFANRVIAVVNGGGLAENDQSAAVNERALAVYDHERGVNSVKQAGNRQIALVNDSAELGNESLRLVNGLIGAVKRPIGVVKRLTSVVNCGVFNDLREFFSPRPRSSFVIRHSSFSPPHPITLIQTANERQHIQQTRHGESLYHAG